MDYGLVTLLPTLLVLGLAIRSRRTLESVLAGALLAFFIMEGFGFLDAMAEATLATLMTEDVAWVASSVYWSKAAVPMRLAGR